MCFACFVPHLQMAFVSVLVIEPREFSVRFTSGFIVQSECNDETGNHVGEPGAGNSTGAIWRESVNE